MRQLDSFSWIRVLFMRIICCLATLLFSFSYSFSQSSGTKSFDDNWKFNLGDDSLARYPSYNDSKWRILNLPHDWSIEGDFSEKNPTTQAEGGLPAGIAWYRKTFIVPASSKGNQIFIDFDGIYRDSEVWINGHYLGKRPNGYISFSYELTPYLKFGQKNSIAVRVDNSAQPNSRWYSGSGIYRNVWLTTLNKIHFIKWGTFITTPQINAGSATLNINTSVTFAPNGALFKTIVYNAKGKIVASNVALLNNTTIDWEIKINDPILWSPEHPYLYKVKLQILQGGKILDDYFINTGIRSFTFDAKKGFSINGIHTKIKGVCLHHDLGALGAALNTDAIKRQLQY